MSSDGARLIAALHAHLEGDTLSLTDAEDVLSRLAELEDVVRELASYDPTLSHGDLCWCAFCFWSNALPGDHRPDCLWLRARRLMGAGGGD